MFKRAISPGVRPYPVYHPWTIPREQTTSDLGAYLRTPFNIGNRSLSDRFTQSHVMPITKWEIIHPHLPIVRITSYSTTVLPLSEEHPPMSQMTPQQITERIARFPRSREILEPYDSLANRWLIHLDKRQAILDLDPKAFDGYTFHDDEKKFIEFALAYREHDKSIVAALVSIPDNTRRFILNLQTVGSREFPNPTPQDLEDLLSWPHTPTHYAVSFVISFQNRWESFTEPNRWLIRFQDDLLPKSHPYIGSNNYAISPRTGSINEEIHDQYPYYWHTTDYMQHKLIGPVVLNIYQSEVLEPGVYSMKPRIDHWPAPGPILKDDRQLFTTGEIWRTDFHQQNRPLITKPSRLTKEFLDRYLKNPDQFGKTDSKGRTLTWGRLPSLYSTASPNPGYPLPGHILTNPSTAPGTKIWNRYDLDDRKW